MTQAARPNLALQIGVVGHRLLPTSQLEAACAAARDFLNRVGSEVLAFQAEDAAATAGYADAAPKLRCLSGLAVGADRGLARVALQLGWSLTAILAFERAEFENDFPEPEAVSDYRELLAKAEAIVELDGDRAHPTDAYVEVGEALIEHSDMLLAIWDGQRARGAGGTAEVVAAALRAGKPVFSIAPDNPAAARFLDPRSPALRDLLRAKLKVWREAEFPQAYFNETRESAPWSASLVGLYDRALAWGVQLPASVQGADAPFPASRLAAEFERADRRASAYGARYRVAGLLRYGLVVPATLGAMVASVADWRFQLGGNLADFLVLIFIMVFSARRWQAPVHNRFLHYRGLAETLRGAVFLAPFASALNRPARDWTSWLAGAYARAEGPGNARFDATSLAAATAMVRAATEAQIAYMRARAARNTAAANRLSRIGLTLSVLGFVFAGVRAGVLVAQVGGASAFWIGEAALVCPALGPVFLGLAGFNEYRRHAARYSAIADQLEMNLGELDAAPAARADRVRIVKTIAEALVAESADWRTLTAMRAISAF